MGYIAVKGGKDAILNAEEAVSYYRLQRGDTLLLPSQLENQMRLAVDRIMSEGSLYAPELSALALKQAEGDVLEAAYLIRAYRSTLPRLGYSEPAQSDKMFLIRRISSAFQDIPWGQVLGPSRDYSLRLLDFALKNETRKPLDPPRKKEKSHSNESVEKVIDYLRREGLMEKPEPGEENDPYDLTRQPLAFPLKRSGRLQCLSRGEEGAVLSFAYASMRGWGAVHPTLAEVRIGYQQVEIIHPYWKKKVSIGSILLSEVDAVCSFTKKPGSDKYQFALGYGLVFGQNDRKAISMAILDRALSIGDGAVPTQDQEFVLSHIDGIEAQGFISHLKLPHYVTFQSEMDRLRKIIEEKESTDE